MFWAAEDTTEVLRFYREFVAGAPDELGSVIRLGTIPPLPVVDVDLHFRPAIAVVSCDAGPVEKGERAVRALRQFGTPLVDLVGPTRYVDHESGLDDTVPHGWHYYWKATSLAGLSDEVIDIVAEHAYDATSPRSYAAIFHMGGAVARAPREATAYPGRDVEHYIIIDAAWLRNRTSPSVLPRPRGHDNSSTPCSLTVPASTSTSSTPTTTRAVSTRPTATRTTAGSPQSKPSTTPKTCSTSTRTSSLRGRISERPWDRHGLDRGAIESSAFVLRSSAGCHCQTAQATHR